MIKTAENTKQITKVVLASILILSFMFVHSYRASIVRAAANHIVISEIQIAGETSTHEFVELYNPTNTSVNLEGWRLTRKTASGSESNLVSNMTGSIPAHGYFLITHPNYTGITPDISYSASSNSISSNNTILLYSDSGETLIDKVGMGEASDSEGQTTASPETGTSIERKALPSSTSTSMNSGGTDEAIGNGEDTDNNSADFVTRSTPQPQTSTSTPEETTNTTITTTPNPTNSPTPILTPSNQTVVISELQFAGNTTSDEFIELYNSTDTSVDLIDWRLRRKTATGSTETNIVSSITGSIPAHGYFLIAPDEYEGTPAADNAYSTSTRLTANNTVYLYKPTEEDYELVDKVGTGESDDSETNTTVSPETGTSIERKAQANSTSATMISGGEDETNGNGYDSDNNANDFVTRTVPQPQNTSSTPEVFEDVTPTPSPSITQDPSPTSSPIVTPTSTPTTTPEPTLTNTPTPTPTPSDPNKPQGYTVAWFPLTGVTCQVEYHAVQFGNWFTIYIPRINCSH